MIKQEKTILAFDERNMSEVENLTLSLNEPEADPGNLSERSWLTVALLHPDGSPIKEVSESECVPITQDGIEIPVVWKNHSTPTCEHCVKITFHGGQPRMDFPYLYSIYY